MFKDSAELVSTVFPSTLHGKYVRVFSSVAIETVAVLVHDCHCELFSVFVLKFCLLEEQIITIKYTSSLCCTYIRAVEEV
jgi:hypothetical protein